MNKRIILITNGTGVVGKQLVQHFSKIGFYVLFLSRAKSKILDIQNTYKNTLGFQINLFEKEERNNLLLQLKEKQLLPHYLINNARNLESLKVEANGFTDIEFFQQEFFMNVIIPYQLSIDLFKLNAQYLRHIINISSIYGIKTYNPNLYKHDNVENIESNIPIQYSVTKAAIIHLTKELAIRFAKHNIQVNCVSYGGIEGRADDLFKIKYANFCPMSRMMRQNEICGVIEFLISENSSYITGQNLIVDGGWTIW